MTDFDEIVDKALSSYEKSESKLVLKFWSNKICTTNLRKLGKQKNASQENIGIWEISQFYTFLGLYLFTRYLPHILFL